MAGGQFTPGKTAEVDGTDEIEINTGLSTDEPLVVVGTSGPDTITMRGYGADLISGAPSEFEITYPLTAAKKSVVGDAGDDFIRMDNVYESEVHGGQGEDTIEAANFAASNYDGGADADTIRYLAASLLTVHATASGAATVDRGGGGVDTLSDMETIVGSPGNDSFYGSPGNDSFDGGGGFDAFFPSGGDDHVDGGDDIDTMSVGASPLPVTFDMTAKTATGEGTDTFDGVEVLQGSPKDDVFRGDPEVGGVILLDGLGGRNLLDLRSAQAGQMIYTSDSTWVFGSVTVVGIPRIIGSPFRDRISVYQSPAVGGGVHFSGMGGNDVLSAGLAAIAWRVGRETIGSTARAASTPVPAGPGPTRCCTAKPEPYRTTRRRSSGQ